MLLALTLLAPLFGPLVVALTSRTPLARAAVDGFVLFFIAGLVGLHVIPESVLGLGWLAGPALIVGLALPKLLHPHDHGHQRSVIGTLGALALGVHAATDGLALAASAASHEDGSLSLAMGVHRVLEGVGVWWLLSGRNSRWQRGAALAALCATTSMAYAGGQWAMGNEFGQWAAVAQLTVAGSLLHLLVWHVPADEEACSLPRTPAPAPRARAASALGACVAAATLFVLEHEHGHEHGAHVRASFSLAALWANGCVGSVLALGMAGIVHAFTGHRRPPHYVASRWLAALQGAVRGLFVSSCSCGLIALADARRREGMRPAGLFAYMVTAPSVGWVGFVLSLIVLGPAMALTRAAGVVVIGTLGAALAAPRQAADAVPPIASPEKIACLPPFAEPEVHVTGAWRRLRDGAQFAAGDMLDFTAPWVLFSLLLCTALRDVFSLATIGAPYDVLALAGLAVVPFLCGAASTLLACLFWQGGASIGATLTFAWLASSTSIASTTSIVREYGWPRAVGLAAGQVAGAMALGAATNWLCMGSSWAALALWPPQLSPWPTIGPACALIAFLGASRALIRLGARGFIGQILWANRAQTTGTHHH